MPTAQDTAYLIEVMPADATTQNFLSRDVDLLVSQIKENLRLTGLKAKKSSVVQGNRSMPYRVPSRSWADPDGCGICAANNLTEKSNELRLQPEHNTQCHSQLRQHHQHQSYQQCYHRNHFHRHPPPHHHHNHHLYNHHRHHHHHHHHHLHHRACCPNSGREEDDPYELLQELLREGSLIKEAVKRLQENLDELERSEDDEIEEDDEEEADEEEDDDNEEVKDNLTNGMVLNRSGAKEQSRIYRRKPYFYDSEEESLSSVYEPLEL